MKPLLTKIVALLAGAWRYRWHGLAAAWIVCVAGWLAVWSIPDKYAVEAKVYIDTDTVLGPLMRGLTVPTDQDQQVAIMLKSLTTRPNLEQIVHLVNPRANAMKPAEMEKAVNDLNNNIDMRSEGVRNLFSIAYVDNNSAYAEAVTQSLLSILVDSNVGDKRRDMNGARSFIDQKIGEYEAKMREAELRRANFKAENLDAINAGGTGDGASAELQTATNDLSAAQITVSSLRSQLNGVPQTVASDQLPTLSEKGASGGSSSPLARLRQAEQTLLDLRSTYTENYPDIIAIKQTIAELQKQVAAAEKNTSGEAPAGGAVGVPNPVYVDLRTRLSAAEVQVALLQHRVGIASAKVENAKKNAVQMIAINNKYADLDRDYNVLQANYAELVKSREAARLSQSMSEQQQSIAFRIIEPPKRTLFPVSPPRLALNSAVLLAGIAAGIALAIGLSIFSGRFTTSEELAEYFSLPVLGVVTVGPNAMAARREKTAITAVTAAFVSLMMIYGLVAFLLTTSIYTKLGI
jgi:polysaccharide chain length determinant protein (PEP-CTERM system associated)